MTISVGVGFVLLLAFGAGADCIPMEKASQRIGDSACVKGKVLRISEGPSGTAFLNFCADYRACPFTVVVFPRDLHHVGDVRHLAGKEIEIHGKIQAYDGRPEIILREARQLRGAAAKLPALPRDYDVERRGRFSAGRWQHPKSSRQPVPHQKGSRGGIPVEEPTDPGTAPQ